MDECTAAFTALSDLMSGMASYFATPAVGEFPEAVGVLDSMDFALSLEELTRRANQAAAFQNGAMQESLNTMVAVAREVDMAMRTKPQMFLNAANDCQNEANYYSTTGQFLVGVMRGAETNGSQC
jgi:hypothetical protein